MQNQTKKNPLRYRDYGFSIGKMPVGKYNAITDVPGVRVGHETLIQGDGALKVGSGPVRTGVTAIIPSEASIYHNKIIGSAFVLNGAGEMSGITQLSEWGMIETPIILTNTMAVGACSNAIVKYLVNKHPGIGTIHDVVIPLVGECDDSWLNDIAGRHVTSDHVYNALEACKSGPVPEGNVGSGTGMITCDFKGGIGTSSRVLPKENGGYTIGVLVMSNFGIMEDFRIDGVPVGKILAPRLIDLNKRKESYGSIITVVGTNAPLLSHQIQKLCKRAALGIGRVGSYAAHGSGEIIIGFSNANTISRNHNKLLYNLSFLLEASLNPLYQAVIEATEEAIINALFSAEDMVGHSGNTSLALPKDQVIPILEEYSKLYKNLAL